MEEVQPSKEAILKHHVQALMDIQAGAYTSMMKKTDLNEMP